MARWSKEKRERVRARILQEARRIFETEGFEGATMRHVARASGLAVGTVFNYFEDKRVLLYAALYDDLEAVRESCVESMPGVQEGLAVLLVHTAGCFFDYYAQRPGLSKALLKEALWAEGEFGVQFQAQVTALGGALAVRIRALQEAGKLAPEAGVEPILLAFFSHYYFVLLMGLRDAPDPARMRAMIGVLARQLEAGIGVAHDVKGEV